jgi:hypothetical protein
LDCGLRPKARQEWTKTDKVICGSERLAEGEPEGRDERFNLEAKEHGTGGDATDGSNRRGTREDRRAAGCRGNSARDLRPDGDRWEQWARIAQSKLIGDGDGGSDRPSQRPHGAALELRVEVEARNERPVDERGLGRRQLLPQPDEMAPLAVAAGRERFGECSHRLGAGPGVSRGKRVEQEQLGALDRFLGERLRTGCEDEGGQQFAQIGAESGGRQRKGKGRQPIALDLNGDIQFSSAFPGGRRDHRPRGDDECSTVFGCAFDVANGDHARAPSSSLSFHILLRSPAPDGPTAYHSIAIRSARRGASEAK